MITEEQIQYRVNAARDEAVKAALVRGRAAGAVQERQAIVDLLSAMFCAQDFEPTRAGVAKMIDAIRARST